MSEPLNPPARTADVPSQSTGPGHAPISRPPPLEDPSHEGTEDVSHLPITGALTDWMESGLALLDDSGRISEINESFTQWFERPPAELIGRSLWILLAERCAGWGQALEEFRSGGSTFAKITLKVPAAARSSQWFSLEIARQPTSSFVRFNSILPPLSELEEATWDEHLRHDSAQRELFVRLLRAEAQLKNLTDRWPGVIFSQRADFTFRFISPKIEDLTGVPVADWQTKPQVFWELVHETDVEELRQQLARSRRTRQPVTSTYRLRHAQTARVTYVMEHRQAITSPGGLLLGYEGAWLDVTRQTIAEKRLTSAAWKETLSVLTMGLAHDFSNVMAGIHALSESFLEQVGPKHDFSEGLEQIKASSQQASQLVHRIIDLHQGKTGECYYHNLNELASDVGDLARKILPRRMPFALELAPVALPVHLDAVEFRHVIINLVLNAIEAMPPQGRLVLRTSAHPQLPPMQHRQGPLPRTPAVCFSVQDSGCGIKSPHLANIFDPFFTTKPADKGSGLGLYNARLFAEKHHGAISVDTIDGKGTTIHLWLPEADFTEAGNPLVPRAVSSATATPLIDTAP